MKNPLLEKFNQPFGTIPFSEIKTEHFSPALDAAIDEAKSEVEAVVANSDSPTSIYLEANQIKTFRLLQGK